MTMINDNLLTQDTVTVDTSKNNKAHDRNALTPGVNLSRNRITGGLKFT